jgi:hypothetical protein
MDFLGRRSRVPDPLVRPGSVDRTIGALRVITVGILMSVLTATAIAFFFRDLVAGPSSRTLESPLVAAVAAVAVMGAVGHVAVRRQVRAELQRRAPEIRASADPAAAVAGSYQRLVIVRAALMEAPALMAVVAYLAGAKIAVLAVAGAAALALVGTMPSRAGLERFAEDLLQS